MSVSVSGKYIAENDSGPLRSSAREFAAAARVVGYQLAKKGHPIDLCMADWEDYHRDCEANVVDCVLEGVREANAKAKIKLFLSPVKPPAAVDGNRPLLQLHEQIDAGMATVEEELLPTVTQYYPESFPSVSKADAVILLGGEDIHTFVGLIGYETRNQPIVALSAFGGAGSQLHHTVLQHTYREAAARDGRIGRLLPVLGARWNGHDSQAASTPPAPGGTQRAPATGEADRLHAAQVVDLAERIADSMGTQRDANARRWNALGIMMILICLLWAAGFVGLSVAARVAAEGTPQALPDGLFGPYSAGNSVIPLRTFCCGPCSA